MQMYINPNTTSAAVNNFTAAPIDANTEASNVLAKSSALTSDVFTNTSNLSISGEAGKEPLYPNDLLSIMASTINQIITLINNVFKQTPSLTSAYTTTPTRAGASAGVDIQSGNIVTDNTAGQPYPVAQDGSYVPLPKLPHTPVISAAATDSSTSSTNANSNSSANASSVPVPLGIINGGDKDGYMAYRPAGADPNDESKIQYAPPLGAGITGPNGEACFQFPDGKQGYITKDPQDPTHSKTIIQFTDAAAAANNTTASNGDMKDSAIQDLNNSHSKDADISKILNNHYDNFAADVSSNQDSIIGRQDWENFAKNDDDPKMNTLVQDPLERAKMRAVAQTVTDRIHNADQMSLSDAMNTFRIPGNQDLLKGAQGNNQYEKLESIATGKDSLSRVSDPAEREKIRTAAAKIIYVPMTDDEKKVSAGDIGPLIHNNHLENNKYGKAQGGPTIFTFLDNAFGSTDNDGSFALKNFKNVALPG